MYYYYCLFIMSFLTLRTDVIILEEAAYCDPGFFYETVAPLMIVGNTTLIGISTLTSEINFYSM